MIYNIFENKKLRKNKKTICPIIIADIHEKDSMIFSILKPNKDIELEIKPLEVGDYLIGETIIERKTINDLISSMMNKRLFEQLKNMEQYKERLLIIEGNKEDLYQKINPNVVRGLVLSIIKNTSIIFTSDYIDTSKYLLVLAKQQLKTGAQKSLHSRIPKTIEEQKQYILESFPNIGPKKAELLLERFKSLNNIFNATEDELSEILKSETNSFKNILEKI